MVLCILALPVFAILGIFSATYRSLAKEAFTCVFKKVTLQPCDTGLDTRIKTSVVGPILRRSQRLGTFVHRHFTTLSVIFVVLSALSLAGVVYGGVNYYLYGNCNGPSSSSFCVFDPSGANTQFSAGGADSQIGECASGDHSPSKLQFNWFRPELHATLAGSPDAPTLWMVGCYNCRYTREVWPTIRALQAQYNFTLVFAHLPLHHQDMFASLAAYCVRAQSPDKFWPFADAMFSAPQNSSWDTGFVNATVAGLGINMTAYAACVGSSGTEDAVIDETQNIAAIGIYGTPTIYVDGTALVGPKPARVYKRLVD